MRHWLRQVAILVMLASLIPYNHALSGHDLDEAHAICFLYVGEQDKPMPEFCIIEATAPQRVGAVVPQLGVEPIKLSTDSWQALLALYGRLSTTNAPRPASFGQYKGIVLPRQEVRYLSKGSMREITQALLDLKPANDAQSELLQRLLLRLG